MPTTLARRDNTVVPTSCQGHHAWWKATCTDAWWCRFESAPGAKPDLLTYRFGDLGASHFILLNLYGIT